MAARISAFEFIAAASFVAAESGGNQAERTQTGIKVNKIDPDRLRLTESGGLGQAAWTLAERVQEPRLIGEFQHSLHARCASDRAAACVQG